MAGNQWLALGGDGVTIGRPHCLGQMIKQSIADVIMPTDVLTLTAAAVKEVHRIVSEIHPLITAAEDAPLRIADVRGRR